MVRFSPIVLFGGIAIVTLTNFGRTPCEYGKRAVAFILDLLAQVVPSGLLAVMGVGLLFADGVRVFGVFLIALALFYAVLFPVFNTIRQGSTGQTLGKRQQTIALVKATTGQPVGILFAFLRLIITWFFNSITFGLFIIVDLLFPAFDKNRQRVVDKILGTLVVDARWANPTMGRSAGRSGAAPPPL